MVKVAAHNVNGLIRKADRIATFFKEEKLDILILSEIRTNNLGYKIGPVLGEVKCIKQNRFSKQGLLVICKPQYLSCLKIIKNSAKNQYIILRLGDIYIAGIYWDPAHNIDRTSEIWVELMEELEGKRFIIIGDFNARIHHPKLDHQYNTRGRHLEQWTASRSIQIAHPTIGRYTRICYVTGVLKYSTLDLALTSQVNIQYQIHQNNMGSDHAPVIFTIETHVQQRRFYHWNYKKLLDTEVQAKFKAHTRDRFEQAAEEISSATSVDIAWDALKHWLNRAGSISCGKICFQGYRTCKSDSEEIKQTKQTILDLIGYIQYILSPEEKQALEVLQHRLNALLEE